MKAYKFIILQKNIRVRNKPNISIACNNFQPKILKNKTFVVSQKILKSAKIFFLEIFRLYGSLIHACNLKAGTQPVFTCTNIQLALHKATKFKLSLLCMVLVTEDLIRTIKN